ncbi:MAG: ABC transporter permease [Candidatus Paceibacterota bacterium]
MRFKDILDETVAALAANKTRSFLTVLGIMIGIASVIVVMAVGAGAQSSITSRISSLGTNLLTISPGGQSRVNGVTIARGSGTTLTKEDASALLLETDLIAAVSPQVSTRTQVIAQTNNTNTTIYGVSTSYMSVTSLELEQGTFLEDAENSKYAKVVVLGPTTRDDLFSTGADVIGQTVRINNVRFTVIGVTVAKGGTGFGSTDDRVYMPIDTAQQYITGSKSLSSISVSVTSADKMTDAQTRITDILLKRHKITDPTKADFSILNQADLAATATSITQTITLLLGSVAGISLVVGGIGIMNMMLTTVRERTREIGLRKAIGAKKKDISFQFLAEAIALTIFGGVIGIIFGYLVAMAFNLTGIITTTVTLKPIVVAFSTSAFIGIVFGYYPAKKASELNPIEALRYE